MLCVGLFFFGGGQVTLEGFEMNIVTFFTCAKAVA